MMREACEAAAAFHAKGGGGATGDGLMSLSAGTGKASSGSESSSLFSSTSSLTDQEEGDGATSSFPPPHRHVSSPSLSSSSLASSESETLQMDGPLDHLSTMLDHLPPLRTGLSKYYQGRSQSFTSLADVSCVEDLAKKTTPYMRRTKESKHYAAALGVKNRLSKTVAKKATPMCRIPPTIPSAGGFTCSIFDCH